MFPDNAGWARFALPNLATAEVACQSGMFFY
jgi:hypothetical protein